MSTKQETKSQNTLNYDKGSKSNYDSLTGAGTNVLSQYMKNPFNNSFYNMGLGQSQAGATAQGSNNMSALMSQMKTSGFAGKGGNAFQMGQMGKIGRSNASMMANANTSNVMSALQRQMTATGMGMSYNPLLTGTSGTQTQTTSGTGTWLPQLLGAAGGAAMGFATGGASTLAQGASSAMKMPSYMSGGSAFAGAPSGSSGIFGTVPGMSAPSPFMMPQ